MIKIKEDFFFGWLFIRNYTRQKVKDQLLWRAEKYILKVCVCGWVCGCGGGCVLNVAAAGAAVHVNLKGSHGARCDIRLSVQGRSSHSPWLQAVIGRTDAEAETSICWPPDVKNWLTGKDLDAGKDWGQEEKGMTDDEMVGWHHRLNGPEFEQALGVGDGQGSLACCSPWGHKMSDTIEQLNWTDGSRLWFWLLSSHPYSFPDTKLHPLPSSCLF